MATENGWMCDYCYEQFDSKEDCELHEEDCDDNPENNGKELVNNDLLELEDE